MHLIFLTRILHCSLTLCLFSPFCQIMLHFFSVCVCKLCSWFRRLLIKIQQLRRFQQLVQNWLSLTLLLGWTKWNDQPPGIEQPYRYVCKSFPSLWSIELQSQCYRPDSYCNLSVNLNYYYSYIIWLSLRSFHCPQLLQQHE